MKISEDLVFADSRIRAEIIAAEDVLHDTGAISMISLDSQAMDRVGEVIARTWPTASKMWLMCSPCPLNLMVFNNISGKTWI